MFRFYQNLLCILLTTLSVGGNAQQVIYHEVSSFQAAPDSRVQLIGETANKQIAFHYRPGKLAELIYFDKQGIIKQQVSLPFIDHSWVTQVQAGFNEQSITFILQGKKENRHYVQSASTDHEGNLRTALTVLDSTDYKTFGLNAYYKIVSSASRQFTTLYRFVTGFSKDLAWFNAVLLDAQLQKAGVVNGYIPIDFEFESIGPVFLNEKGQFFFTVSDKALNYRLGSEVKLYQTRFDSLSLAPVRIYLKEKKPVELLMTWNDQTDRLVMGSVYYDFYEKHVNGALYLFYDPVRGRCDTIVYTAFDKSLTKDLKKKIHGIPLKDALNNMHSRHLYYTKSGSLVLVSDMYNNSTFSGPPNRLNRPQKATTAYPAGQANGISSNIQENRLSPPISTKRNSPAPDNTLISYDPYRNLAKSQEALKQQGESDRPAELSAVQIASLLTANKEMDFKTVVMGIDPSLKPARPSWVRSLFMPQTPFTTAVLLTGDSAVSVFSYELSPARHAYLYRQTMSLYGKSVQQQIMTERKPMLYFGRDILTQHGRTLYTLWRDPLTGNLGLAELNW